MESYERDRDVAYSYVSKTSAKTDVCENGDYKITTCEAYGRKSGASTPTDDYELDYAGVYSYVVSTNANSDIPAYDTRQQSTGDYRMSACEAYETNTGTSELSPSDDYEQEHGAAYSYVTTTLAHLQGVQTQSRSGAFSRGDDHSLKQREQGQKETTEEEEEVYNKYLLILIVSNL